MNFVTCVSNATVRGLQVMNGDEVLPTNMCAEEAATTCSNPNPAHPVIVFESATVMSVLGLTSTDDILNQSPRTICASVPALKVCPSKFNCPNSVKSTFGGDTDNLSNVTWDSGPVLHRGGNLTLVKCNSSGIGGPQFKTPPMSDSNNTNGNDLVSMGSRGLVPRIQAVRYMCDHSDVLLVYDASNGSTSLISILMNKREGLDFFPFGNGMTVRSSFTLPQVRASMPGGLHVGGADNLWLVKVLIVGQHTDDFTIAVDADERITAINNRHQEFLQANAPDDSSYGKDCIVSENGVDIAKFSSLNLARGKTKKCDNYAQYGVGENCIVPGQSGNPKYSLPLLRAATDSRGLRSSKYPTRFLRLRRVNAQTGMPEVTTAPDVSGGNKFNRK